MPNPITPISEVAENAGVPAEVSAAYQGVELRYGTGLLPATVWAAELGHDAPTGNWPPTVTWLYYEQNRAT